MAQQYMCDVHSKFSVNGSYCNKPYTNKNEQTTRSVCLDQ